MTTLNDPLSDWHKELYNKTRAHRSQHLSHEHREGMFGNSTFGFLTQAFDFKLPRIPTVGGMSLGIGPDMFDQAKRQLKGLATNWLIGGLFRKEHYSHVNDRMNQYMEDHGYLMFVFPNDDFFLPFFENPTITASRNANYADVPVMNRNEPWRVWTGASPEKVDITFNMTLPHIMQFAIKTACSLREQNWVPESYRESIGVLAENSWNAQSYDYEQNPEIKEWVESREYVVSEGTDIEPSQRPNTDAYELTQYISFMIDLIRASVIGSVEQNYVEGPPIIRLKFGTLYDEASFVAKSYSFKFDGKEGYDNETLLPRRIKVRMSLESLHQRSADVLPGWDSILHL